MARRYTFTESDLTDSLDFSGVIKIFEDNSLDYGRYENADEMKQALSTLLGGPVGPRDRTEMQEKFGSASEKDAKLRNNLCDVYTEFKKIFDIEGCTEDVVQLINSAVPDCQNRVDSNHLHLKDNGCPILVAGSRDADSEKQGESGAGKSSFLNLLIGSDINPIDDSLSATSTICELHNSERVAEAEIIYGEDHPDRISKGQTKEIIKLDVTNPKNAQKALRDYTIGTNRTNRIYDLVKIRWPIPMLQGKVFLVDSPGVGESDPINAKVLEYIPKAVTFIYIINSSINGGGISENRLELVLKPLTAIHTDEELQMFNPKSAIFIFNKWDEVKDEETRRTLLRNNIKKLKILWPGIDEEKQVFCLSVTNARKQLTNGQGETVEYKNLLDGLYNFMETSLSVNIENHQRWLSFVHGRVLNIVQTNFTCAKRSQVEKKQIAKQTREKLRQLQERADEVIEELEMKLENEMDEISAAVVTHLAKEETVENVSEESDAMDVRTVISEDMAENEQSTHEKIQLAISREVRIWISDKKLVENAIERMISEFKRHFDRIGSMLQGIEAEMQGTSSCVSNATPLFIKAGSASSGMSFSRTEKLVIGLTAPIWLPLTVIALSISLPVIVTVAIIDKVKNIRQLSDYKRDKKPFVLRWTRQAVQGITAETIKESVIQKELAHIYIQLKNFKQQIPQIVRADLQLMEKMEGEMREQADITAQYSPLLQQLKRSFGKLQLVKLRYLQEDEPDFYPISDIIFDERLGRGAFGEVHKVSVILKGETDPSHVAAKVMKEKLTEKTSIEFSQERDVLRSFNHENIVKYMGTSINNDDGFVLLMELCRCTLYDVIFRKEVSVPGNQTDKEAFVLAFKNMVDRARQISSGLAHIHEKKYVHRDVKLSNILVTDKDVLKLSDMGQAKPESSITGTYRGTRFYRDPVVLRGDLATQEADVYSLAIIMYELWFGFIVYSDIFAEHLTDVETVEEEIRDGNRKPRLDVAGYRRPILEWCSLLEDCWRDKPIDGPLVRKSSSEIYGELGRMLRTEFITERVEADVPEGLDPSLCSPVDNSRGEDSSYF